MGKNIGSLVPPNLTTAERDAITSPPTGAVIFNTTTGVIDVFGGAVWVESGGGGGADSISIDLGGNNERKALGRNITNQVLKEFVYRGATKTMTNVKAIVNRDSLASITVEIYDFTNAQSICSVTTTTAGKQIANLGTISNLPAGDAIFQIRASTGTGGNNDNAFLYSVDIVY